MEGRGKALPKPWRRDSMNTTVLIDAIVRQTVVLIATLATAAGQREQLSHVADEVFAQLVLELRRQGLGNRVIADMFGLALRTYQSRMARLSRSRTSAGGSLWDGVLTHIQANSPILRNAVLQHFYQDDEEAVRSVLRDLVDSGLVARSGRGVATQFEAALRPEVDHLDEARLDSLVLVCIHRNAPIEPSRIATMLALSDPEPLAGALARLADQGAIRSDAGAYHAVSCVIDYGSAAGWEAAVLDHYQAMVSALVAKLGGGQRRAERSDTTGGSTYVFDVTTDHPLRAETERFLSRMREEASDLRARIRATSTGDKAPRGAPVRVTVYLGQLIQQEEEGEE